jgi:hypothetical protein
MTLNILHAVKIVKLLIAPPVIQKYKIHSTQYHQFTFVRNKT